MRNNFLPKCVWIQTINTCNYRCTICPYSVANKEMPSGEMKEALFHKIITEIIKFKSLKWISFNMQNEPLMDKNIYEKIKYVKAKTNIPVCITTNGYYLNDKNILKLIDIRLDKIIISLNAFSPKTYKKMMGMNCFEHIIKNIEALISRKPFSLKLILSFVITEDNINEAKKFKSYWKSREIATRMYYANNRGGILKNPTFLFSKRNCRVPFEEINIMYNGNVVLCRQDWNNSVVFGNLNENYIKDIWNSIKFNKFREDFQHRIKSLSPCERCNRNENIKAPESYYKEMQP